MPPPNLLVCCSLNLDYHINGLHWATLLMCILCFWKFKLQSKLTFSLWKVLQNHIHCMPWEVHLLKTDKKLVLTI